METIKRFDIFHSPSYDIAEATNIGGGLSLMAIVFCAACFFNEIGTWRNGYLKEMIYLENTVGGKEMVSVQLDMTIYDLPCDFVTLDIQDGHGRYDIDEHATRHPHAASGDQDDHHNVEKIESEEGGCQFKGVIHVRHMKGNFHFTPRGEHHHPNTTIAHRIDLLKFGDEMNWFDRDDEPEGTFNTLGLEDRSSVEGETHDYLLKLVRTEVYDDNTEEDIYPYQYTYTHRHFVGHHKGKPLPPRIFFRLDFSPLTLKYTRVHEAVLVFLSRHLALIGGTFAVLKLFYNGAHVAKEGKFQ